MAEVHHLGEVVLVRDDGQVTWVFESMSPATRNDVRHVLDAMDDFIDENPGFPVDAQSRAYN